MRIGLALTLFVPRLALAWALALVAIGGTITGNLLIRGSFLVARLADWIKADPPCLDPADSQVS